VLDRLTFHYVRAAELASELGGPDAFNMDGHDVREKALEWLDRAATRAEASEIHVVATRLYSEGLALLGEERGARHQAFLTGRARALAQQREIGRARADIVAAIGEARSDAGSAESLARALLVRADIEQKELCWAESQAVLQEAAEVFEALGDRWGLAEVQRLRGFDALLRHEYIECTGLLEDAQARFEALDDRRGVAWVLQNLAWCAFYSGDPEAAETRLRASAAMFEELGDVGGEGWAYGLLAWTRFQQGFSLEAEQMAESIIDDIRRRGERWATGMMLVLIGSVRLWTGRAASAIPCLTEAHELFLEMDEELGRNQSRVILGRALVVSGRIAEGLAILPGADPGRDGAIGLDSQFTVIASAGATVQLGDIERTQALLDQLPPADLEHATITAATERVVATALHAVQRGDARHAVELLQACYERLQPKFDPNVGSALALAQVAAGALDEGVAAAEEVEHNDRASYYDRLLAGLAQGLALGRRGEEAAAVAAFDQLQAAADATDDRVTAAIVCLADAMAASARGEADAAKRSAVADRRLAELGLAETGWRRVFSLALGISSAA
jgi:tetratricopeptide (TPR) repeat protein